MADNLSNTPPSYRWLTRLRNLGNRYMSDPLMQDISGNIGGIPSWLMDMPLPFSEGGSLITKKKRKRKKHKGIGVAKRGYGKVSKS